MLFILTATKLHCLDDFLFIYFFVYALCRKLLSVVRQTQTSLSSACTLPSHSPIWPRTNLTLFLQRSSRIPVNLTAFLGIAVAMHMSAFLHEVSKTQPYLSVSRSFYLSHFLIVHLFIFIALHLSFCLCTLLLVCLSFNFSHVYSLFFCLSLFLFACTDMSVCLVSFFCVSISVSLCLTSFLSFFLS